MLYLTKSKIVQSKPALVASGQNILDEGQALVVVNEGGNVAVKASTGTGGEVFFGIAAFERRTPSVMSAVKRIAGNGAIQTVTLPNYVASSARMTYNGNALNGGSPEASITVGGVITTIAFAAGNYLEVTYQYNPTVLEAERLVGTVVGASAVQAGAQVGAVYQGELWISNFDTTSAWAVGSVPKLGANGVLTLAGSGTAIPGFVTHVPTEAEPYLGVDLR